MAGSKKRRLLEYWEVAGLLNLSLEKVKWLVETGQLHEVRICGKSLLDGADVDRMVRFYRRVQERSMKNAQQSPQVSGR